MGNRMMCVTTPKKQVTQGDANTPQNHCVTTPPPKGGEVVVTRSVGPREVVTQNSVTQQQPHSQERHSL
ncbi:hypothetical protein SAMN05444149_1084 [Pseudosulfitobacter pseudonitzschiae]|nr:hypothetical protein SAMN05444149_1084 [Pseudosulfitobacter pseudonitzschiae]